MGTQHATLQVPLHVPTTKCRAELPFLVFPTVLVDDPRTTLNWNRTLRVQTLPVLLFSGGHVAFVQRLPWK